MNDPSKIAYITAGAGGMYCGSCMHDNTLARALTELGVDVQLIPLYTPIRTDEEDVSVDRVFFNGVNVYLQQKLPLFRHLPPLLDRLLDLPWLVRWATSRGVATDAAGLGALTVSMLRGKDGNQRKELAKLGNWLAKNVQPQLINLSNMLIGGCVPELKQQLQAPVVVTLQGDDVFLDQLPQPHRRSAFAEIYRLVEEVDGFIVHSQYYADYMSDYFRIPAAKLHLVPLGIDTRAFREIADPAAGTARRVGSQHPPTIGYLARLAPEKGLHVLVDAFIALRRRDPASDVRLAIAGWLGPSNRAYAETEFAKLRRAGLQESFHYAGAVDRAGKLRFLQEIDVLSVPTIYHEPKGLFVLESLAAGVPVVQPSHGAFPELLAATGGGCLVPPEDPGQLAEALHKLLADSQHRSELGRRGRTAVHDRFDASTMARATLDVYRKLP